MTYCKAECQACSLKLSEPNLLHGVLHWVVMFNCVGWECCMLPVGVMETSHIMRVMFNGQCCFVVSIVKLTHL